MAMAQIRPVVDDQYTAARIYFASIVGMLLCESLLHLPQYLSYLRTNKYLCPDTKHPKSVSSLSLLIHKLCTLPPLLPSIITTHRLNTLLRLVIFVGLNILFSITRLKYSTDYKLAGWLCISNGGLTLLISPRGTNILSLFLRFPNDTLLIYHRWCGRATVIHATIHFSLTIAHFIRTEQVATVLTEFRIRVGITSFIVLGIIFISSLAFIRRKTYELFYYLHFLFIIFVIGACIHATHGPEFLLPGLGLWLLDRAMRLSMSFRNVAVAEVKIYEGGVTKFVLEGVKVKHPGMMVWVLFPGVSWNWHPFTVSPTVTSSIEGDENRATIAVRGLGGWTKSIQKFAGAVPDTDSSLLATKMKVRIDGPYHVGSINWGLHPVTVIVAGGIGITPGIGIIAHIIRTAPPGRESHIHLLWAVKDRSHIAWFSEELTALAARAKSANSITFNINIHVTGRVESQDTDIELMPAVSSRGRQEKMTAVDNISPWTVLPGRPDLTTWLMDVKAMTPGLGGGAVNVCGPRSLVLGTRSAALRASSKSGLFCVEEEVFEV